jgi:SulP family sulfate permease
MDYWALHFFSGRTLILCGARKQPAQFMHQAEFEEVVGRDNICANVRAALQRAETVYRNAAAKAALAQ